MLVVPRKNYFIGNLASVAVILKNRFIVGTRVTYKNIVKQTDKARERLLCAQIALKAIPFNLPDNFIGDLGASVPVLIKKAIGEKAASNSKPQTTYTCNVFTLTGYELWTYICANKNIPGHIAQLFAHLTEKEVRQLSAAWLDLETTERSLSKFLLDCGSFNSPKHRLYLWYIGLTLGNVDEWLPRIFEDRIRLDYHSISIAANNALRVTYEVPIPLGPSGTFKKLGSSRFFKRFKMLASDLYSLFNVNMVSFTIVVEFTFDDFTSSYKTDSGTLITAFLHNRPYKDDDKDTLVNVGPNKFYWGGTLGVITNYIQTIGTTGMPALPVTSPIGFQVLNIGFDAAAQKVEALFSNGIIETQVLSKFMKWVCKNKNRKHAEVLQNDYNYIKEHKKLCALAVKKVNRKFKQILAAHKRNKLI
jgi:hypothetical protein